MQMILLSALLVVLAGCAHKKSSDAAVQEQAVFGKPTVALVPLIDHSGSGLSWSLSDEFTSAIHQKLAAHEKLHLAAPSAIRAITKKLSDAQDPFGAKTGWIKKTFAASEYAVFMELVDHSEKPLYATAAGEPPAEFTMSVRLRVFDLRGPEPKVVLQELVSDTQRVPKQFTSANFYQVPWGHEIYDISPLGMAHAQLFKEIAERVEDYILLSNRK